MRPSLFKDCLGFPAAALVGLCINANANAATFAEAWVTIDSAEDIQTLKDLPLSFAEGRETHRLRMIGPSHAFETLRERGFLVETLRTDHRQRASDNAGYHDPDEMRAALLELAEQYPERARFVDLGESVQGREISGLRIAGGAPWNVRILGGHHGNEGSSLEVPLAIAESLLTSDSSTLPTVWVVPHVNPDGVAEGSRYNARDVDLNRNYEYKWSETGSYSGEAAMSEPETRAVQTLSLYRHFASGLSIHSGAENIGWPWNYQEADSTDETLLASQATAYAEACEITGFYATNGADWYITNGDTNDWSYGRHGSFDYTLEVSKTKTPPAEDLELVIAAHLPPALEFIERKPSVVFNVQSQTTGSPIAASIRPFGGWKTRAGPDGVVARWLEPGETTLVVSAEGYTDQSLTLTIEEDTMIVRDVLMEPDTLEILEPDDRLLAWGDPNAAFSVTGKTKVTDVTLFRQGFADIDLDVDDGLILVDTSALEPGPWGLQINEMSSPNTLFIGERTDRVRISSVNWDPPVATLAGEGFGAGSKAFVIGAPDRSLQEISLIAEDDKTLSLDLTEIDLSGTLDLVLVSHGAQLTVLNLTGEAQVDTAAPPDTDAPITMDTATPTNTASPPSRGGCGCAIQSGGLFHFTGALWGLLMIGWLPRRRTFSNGTSA